MTKQTKILLGVGVVALAYYFYTKRKGSGVISQVNDKTPQKPYMPQVNPYSEGGALQPRSIPHAYRLKEDFSGSIIIPPNVYANATFKKGQVISALRNPYMVQATAVGQGSLATTLKGGVPNFQMSGQPLINIPERILEKL